MKIENVVISEQLEILKKYNLVDEINFYIENSGLITTDLNDIKHVLDNKKITACANIVIDNIDDFKFNYLEEGTMQAVIVISANNYISLIQIDRCIAKVRRTLGESAELIYGNYIDNSIIDNGIKIFVLGTK